MGIFKGKKDLLGQVSQMQEEAMQLQEQAMQLQQQAMAQPGMGAADVAAMGDAATLNAAGAEMRRLWDVGLDGDAVIKGFTDTGERVAGNSVLDLQLVVTLAGGEPYEVTHRMTIAGSDTSGYEAGSQYPVKVDPENRDNLTFAPQS